MNGMNKLFASQLLAAVCLPACLLVGPREGEGSPYGGGGAGGSAGNGGTTHGDGGHGGNPSNGEGGAPQGFTGRWRARTDPVSGGSISQISFVDPLHGYLLVSDLLPAGTQSVYYTADGGDTWQSREIANDQPYTIAFANGGQSVWIGGSGDERNTDLWYSSNGGKTFAPFPFSPLDWIGGSFFWDENTGIVSSETGDRVYTTSNAGAKWTTIELDRVPGASVLTALGDSVYVVGGVTSQRSGAAVAYSPNRGATWTQKNLKDNANLYEGGALLAVAVVSPTELWVAGQGAQIYHSTDSMATWTQVENVPSSIETFGGIAVDGQHIMALGWGDALSIYESNDGGKTFAITFQGGCAVDCDQLKLTVVSPDLAFAYGYAGTFYRFSQGT
jgi:photosystem II stability/assembly factor-like uncharacterized protein